MSTRVLHVLPCLVATDGLARAVGELARRLPDLDHHLVTNHAAGRIDGFRSTTEVGGDKRLFGLTRRAELAETVARKRPDVVHVHGGALASALAASPAFRNCPVVVTVHKWLQAPTWRELVAGGWQQRRHSSIPPLLALASAVGATHLNRWAARSGRVANFLSPDPRIVERLAALTDRPPVHAPGGAAVDDRRAAYRAVAPVVVFAGKAERARGLEVLLEAFPRVQLAIPRARLRLLLLPNAYAHEVRARVASGPLADLVDIRLDACADLRAELADCQVAAFPFVLDATITPTLAAAEALSTGVPVVGTAVGCLAPLIRDGVNGRVVAVGDASCLADAIVDVLADESRWARLSAAARTTVAASWSWDKAAEVTAEVYERVLQSRSFCPAGQPIWEIQ